MFSILVSELTAELLKKAEYWKIVGVSDLGGKWADTRPHYALIATGEPDYPLYLSEGSRHYHKNLRCFPVALSPDGTETRLECPRMPDEQVIEEWQGFEGKPMYTSAYPKFWTLFGPNLSIDAKLPTPEHSPRLTLEGEWGWSTRR